MEVEIITYGAAIRALRVPDREGRQVDVVLGYDSIAGYEENGGYLGALVGRYANRIGGASFPLDGKTAALTANEGKNQLHGGPEGFSFQVFEAEAAGDSALRLTYISPHGECGFPGTLRLQATYTLTDSALRLRYEATCDSTTCCCITNHSYFNLNGGGSVTGHRLWLAAEHYTDVNAALIPTRLAAPAADTEFDFTREKEIGRDMDGPRLRPTGGYDHSFVLTPAQGLRLAARLTGERSGISMETWTEKPALQLYTANGLNTTAHAKGGVPYGRQEAVCLETQFPPDSPNHPEWGDVLLRPGERYDYTTEYRFSTI